MYMYALREMYMYIEIYMYGGEGKREWIQYLPHKYFR